MQGWFTNQSGDRIDVEVGSLEGDLTLTSLQIDSDTQDTVYKPIRYTSCEFGVLTDDIRLYNGVLLGSTITIKKNNNVIWSGIIVEVPNNQPFNYQLEELSFSAVDRLTQFKSQQQAFSKSRISFKNFLLGLLGEFYYFPFLDIDLDTTFSYQAYMDDESDVVYKSQILESILEYLGVSLMEYHSEYYILNPHCYNRSAGEKINSNGSTSALLSFDTKQINKYLIHDAGVQCSWKPSINSITLVADYKELGSGNVDPIASDDSNYWLAPNYEYNYGVTEAIEGPISDVWGNTQILFPKTGSYPYVDGVYDDTRPMIPNVHTTSQFNNAIYRDQDSITYSYALGFYVNPKTLIYYKLRRYGFSPYVDYYTYFKKNQEMTGKRCAEIILAETKQGQEVLDTVVEDLNVGGQDDEKKINAIEHSNYNITQVDSEDAGLFGCCELSYADDQTVYTQDAYTGAPKGSPSFSSMILVYGCNGVTYIAGDYAYHDGSPLVAYPAVDYDPQIDHLYPICKRTYKISPTPLQNSSLTRHYIVFNGAVQFFVDQMVSGYSKAYQDEKFSFDVSMRFLDDEDNVVLTKDSKIEYMLNKDANLFDPISTNNNVTWVTGINESGFAIPLGDVGTATQLELTIYPIWYFKHEFKATDQDIDPSDNYHLANSLVYNLNGEITRQTNVLPVDHYLLNLSAVIATGFVENEDPDPSQGQTSKDKSSTVYYWKNEEASLVGAEDLDISNKLCTYDGKSSTVSCPQLGQNYLGKIECYYYDGEWVSEIFRFGELIDQYKHPTIGFEVPIRGEICPMDHYTYPYVNQSDYVSIGYSYDVVKDATTVNIEELKDLTEVELV